jgi:hypothetical protein
MSETTSASQHTAAPKSLPARIAGVIFSPGETFANIVAYPRWFGVLAVVVLVATAGSFWLLSTEVGQSALLDQQIRSVENWGGTVTDEQHAQFERMLPMMRYFAAGSTLVTMPVVTFLLAGVLFGVFNALLAGNATYKQVLAVVAHSGAVSLVQQLVSLPLSYALESLSGATNLAVFLPFLEEGSLPARFFGSIDLFIIWWVVVLGIGLSVLYRRRTSPVVLSLLGVYVAIAGLIAIVMRLVAGGQ